MHPKGWQGRFGTMGTHETSYMCCKTVVKTTKRMKKQLTFQGGHRSSIGRHAPSGGDPKSPEASHPQLERLQARCRPSGGVQSWTGGLSLSRRRSESLVESIPATMERSYVNRLLAERRQLAIGTCRKANA
eukprot:2136432-Amphidinium_carterae.1